MRTSKSPQYLLGPSGISSNIPITIFAHYDSSRSKIGIPIYEKYKMDKKRS